MAEERYDRHDILAIPDLTPKRSYESDGIVQAPGLQTPIQKPVRELRVIDDLDELTSLADLLPPEIGDIIRDINRVLSEDSQGKLIIAIEQGGFPPPITIIPPSTPPEGIGPVNFPPISGGPGSETWGPGTGLPSNGGGEIDGPGSETWEPGTGLPGSTGGGTEGPEGEMGGPGTSSPGSGGSTSGGPGSGTEHPGTWPSEQEGSGGGGPGSETKGPGIETKGYGTSHPTDGTWIIGGQHEPNDGDYDVDDIFSAPPTFTVELEPTDSLVDLARKAYRDDDLDIKADYVAKMTQNIARFYQVMSTLAVDGGMPDYSYLMREFDGTAVSTSDANQRHLIDYICKNQIIYDQRLRQMNLTHTAENTLIMTRGFSAAEAQRERYFGEKFKANMNDTASTLSNDILEKERQNANKKYKEAAYNMYKYLDSASKYTNALLNIRIDEAAAKVQLSNTGSDIYAITPPPPPTADNIDDGFDTTQKQTEAGIKYVQDAQKDSVMGYQASGGGASYSGGGGALQSVTATADTKSIFDALIRLGYNDTAACGIMGNIQQECSFNVESGRGKNAAACGLFQWGNGCDGSRWQRLLSMYPDPACWNAGNQLSYMYWECENGYTNCLPGTLNNFSTPEEAAVHFEENFEGAGDAQNGKRMNYARQFYDLYGKK